MSNNRRPHDADHEAGQSQDASRHQQDAVHHKGHKSPQQGATDDKGDQQSQGGSGPNPSDQKRGKRSGK
jgi:hypothetical protein